MLKYMENENLEPYYFSQYNKHLINNFFLLPQEGNLLGQKSVQKLHGTKLLYFETEKHILSKIIFVPLVRAATEDLISMLYHRVCTVRENQGKKKENLRKVRENQATFSMVWRNLCFPD